MHILRLYMCVCVYIPVLEHTSLLPTLAHALKVYYILHLKRRFSCILYIYVYIIIHTYVCIYKCVCVYVCIYGLPTRVRLLRVEPPSLAHARA